MTNFLTVSSPAAYAQLQAQADATRENQRRRAQATNALVAQYGDQAADPEAWHNAVTADTASRIAPLQVSNAELQAKQAQQSYDKNQAAAVIGTLSHLIETGTEPGAALDMVSDHAKELGVDPEHFGPLRDALQANPRAVIKALNDQLNPDSVQGQPIYSQGADGAVKIGYATKNGRFKNIDVGEGQTVLAPGVGAVQVIKNEDGTYSLGQLNKAGGVNAAPLAAGAAPMSAVKAEATIAQGDRRLDQGDQRIRLEAARVKLMAQREVRIANNAGAGGGALTPETVKYLAEQFRTTGKLPPMGQGGAALRAQIYNVAAQQAHADGSSGQADAYLAQSTKERGTAVNDLGKATPNSAGGRVQSANALVAHLDQLQTLGTALANGNVQAINAAKNAYQAQVGQAAPTNFETVKRIAADEATKFIIANGGGVKDREEAQKAFARASSPQQLAGAIANVQHLAGGQLNGMRQRYQAIDATQAFDATLTPRTKQVMGIQPAAPSVAKPSGGWSVVGVK